MKKELHSVLTSDLTHCYITGQCPVAIHHIFGGSNRKLSEKYGFIVPLIPFYHNTSDCGVHFDRKLDLKLKWEAQQYFEDNIGTRKEFIDLFGKSWL